MEQDRERKTRFCWPLQDRGRAKSPSKAPRKSPVFSASVCSFPLVRRPVERLYPRLRLAQPVLQKAAKPVEVPCGVGAVRLGCGSVWFPGRTRLPGRAFWPSCNELSPPEVVTGPKSVSRSGFARVFVQISSSIARPNDHAEMLVSPDWRIMGDQDLPEPG
jgi:hypothetical protein